MGMLTVVGTLLFLSTLAIAQNQKAMPPAPPAQKAEWVEINSYAKAIEQFTKANPKKKRMFGNVAEEEDKEDKWLEFKSAKELEDRDGVYDSAYVWLKDGKLVSAFLSFTSGSGDWYHYVYCYFRADGTLAKIHAQLNTFSSESGGLSVVRERFYSASGKLLHSSIRFLDLQTQKPRKRENYMDMPIPVYKNVRALPFAKLLKT